MLSVQVALAVGAMLVPTLLIGAAFPCAVQVVVRGGERVARDVGRLYAVNTLGAIVGTVVAGFGLIPLIGAQNTAKVAVVLNVALGLVLVAAAFRALAEWQRVAAGALAVACRARTGADPDLECRGHGGRCGHLPAPVPAVRRAGGLARATGRQPAALLSRRAHRHRERAPEGPLTSLRVNGKTDASNGLDMHMQLMLGHLPLLLQPDARSALVIGLGSGVTVGAVAAPPGGARRRGRDRAGRGRRRPRSSARENRDVLRDRRVHLAHRRRAQLPAGRRPAVGRHRLRAVQPVDRRCGHALLARSSTRWPARGWPRAA